MSSKKHPKYTQELLPENINALFLYDHFKLGRRIITTCVLSMEGSNRAYKGVSICMPNDKFNEERGLAAARGRAIKRWYMDSSRALDFKPTVAEEEYETSYTVSGQLPAYKVNETYDSQFGRVTP